MSLLLNFTYCSCFSIIDVEQVNAAGDAINTENLTKVKNVLLTVCQVRYCFNKTKKYMKTHFY